MSKSCCQGHQGMNLGPQNLFVGMLVVWGGNGCGVVARAATTHGWKWLSGSFFPASFMGKRAGEWRSPQQAGLCFCRSEITRIWGFDVQQLRGVLDVIVCGVNPTARVWSWPEFVAPEESRAQEAGVPCRQVCAAGSDMATGPQSCSCSRLVCLGTAPKSNLCCH